MKGEYPSPRGANSERGKNPINFSRTSLSILIKFGSNRPWINGIQVCSNVGSGTLQR
jgi:hypothetical protein